jgi:hypothetical protein
MGGTGRFGSEPILAGVISERSLVVDRPSLDPADVYVVPNNLRSV